MNFPGRIIRVGETDRMLVAAIAARLAHFGYPTPAPAAGYDAQFKRVVKLYQAQHVDLQGKPLLADGEIGPLTWGALFDPVPVAAAAGAHRLAQAALAVAVTQVGVREAPVGSNRGPQVDAYLESTGTPHGSYWCMALVHWCFLQAAGKLAVPNAFPKTAGCIDAWNRSKPNRITKAEAVANPALIVPGAVFILDYGGGMGHTGIVESSAGGTLQTIEGNSNNDGSRNGIGVFRLNSRTVMTKNLKGFIILP